MTVPSDRTSEKPSKTAWPTIAATGLGRLVGRLAGTPGGFGPLRLGNLLALATIPFALVAYAWMLVPPWIRRYRLTNRRVVVLAGLGTKEAAAVSLTDFDDIQIEVLPGQEWLRSGNLLFLSGGRQTLRLEGVSRPENFRQACLKNRAAVLAVQRALAKQSASQPTALAAAAQGNDGGQ